MAKRLSEAEKLRIIELRLGRVPVRQCASEVGCSIDSVMGVFHRYLDETAGERTVRKASLRAEAVQRLEQIGAMARLHYHQAKGLGDLAACARFLRVEIQAIMSSARLEGLEAPQEVTLSGDPEAPLNVTVTIEPLTATQRQELAASTIHDLIAAGFAPPELGSALVQSYN